MRTAEEHHHSEKFVAAMRLGHGVGWTCDCVSCTHIRKIQDEAIAHGMTIAAKTIEPIPGDCEYGMITHIDAENTILTARDNKIWRKE